MKKQGCANLFKADQAKSDDEVTLDKVLGDLIIWGTHDKVADELLVFHEETGDFGTLLYPSKDWALSKQGLGRPRALPPLDDPAC